MSELQLQEGKSYYDRTGRRHGPLVRYGTLFRSPDKTLWYANGRRCRLQVYNIDLVREAKADGTQGDFKLEHGKSYLDNGGRIRGPVIEHPGGFFAHDRFGYGMWLSDGLTSQGADAGCRPLVGLGPASHPETAASTVLDDRVPVGGLVNSKVPPYHLIPPVVFRVLAGRFQRGQQNLGDKAWNAQSADQSPLRDRAALMERINHLQNHLLRLQEDLAAGKSVDIAEDPAAILWGGAFIVASIDAVSQEGA